jgi:tetratricopeptide (TPR) repeat protein
LAAEAQEKLAGLPAEDTEADDPIAFESPQARRSRFERRKLAELAVGLRLDRAEAEQAFLEGDHAACAAAIEPLVAREASGEPLGFADAAFLASRLVDLGRLGEALPIIERLLKADPETPMLAALKAEILFRRRDWIGVVAAASEGLGLVYFNPRLHLILGIVLARLGEHADAINELHVALRQNPALVPAYVVLEKLHKHDPLKAQEYRRQAQSLRERTLRLRRELAVAVPTEAASEYDFSVRCQAAPQVRPRTAEEVVVVSGLPRSGTSMLMRVLEAAGLPILADGLRPADENNRLGYYEYEPVKDLARGKQAAAWIGGAAGRAVKVVVPLVPSLPASVPVRLLVLHRPLGQVLASQEAMKGRLGTTARVSAAGLSKRFIAEIEGVDALVASRPAWQVLHVAYERMLADPLGECRRIAGFLGSGFDVAAAAAAVDPSQRRHM